MSMSYKILFLGNYEPQYNRTAIIKKGLIKLGHKVIELPFKYKNFKIKKQIKNLVEDCDFIYLPSFTHKYVPFIKNIVKTKGLNKKVIFDPLISRYITKVYDYQTVSKYSINALLNKYYDKKSMEEADFIITDTLQHLNYFHEKYNIPLGKMKVVYIGNDFDLYYPQEIKKEDNKYIIGFYGSFNPLQGIIKIIETANLLKKDTNIIFRIIGDGFDYNRVYDKAKEYNLSNVEFIGRVEENQLVNEIRKFDIALGIFGQTIKSDMVIPNKIYHYSSCKKPIITKDTPAIRELFSHRENIFLVNPNPFSIKNAIIELINDNNLREKISNNAYKLIKEEYNEVQVAKRLVKIMQEIK